MTHDAGLMPYTTNEGAGLVKHRNCPVCTVDDARELQRLTGFQFFSDNRAPAVDLIDVQCHRCFAIYKNPTYTRRGMDVLFAQAGRSYGSENQPARVAEQVAWMAAHGVTGTVGDYGCGSGAFLAALPPGAHQGIEIDSEMVKLARATHPDLTFHHGEPHRMALPDVWTLWHVLEHLPHPLQTLQSLHHPWLDGFASDLKRTQRRLIVEVPVLEQGFTADICGFFSAQHTTHFSVRSLTNMLALAGWQVETEESMTYNGWRVLCSHGSPVASVDGNADDALTADGYLEAHKAACAEVDERFKAGIGSGSYILWGAGMHSEVMFHETSLKDRLPKFVIDGDPGKQGTLWRKCPIVSPTSFIGSQVVDSARRGILPLVISSYGSQREIKAEALALGVPDSSIVTLYGNPVVY